METTEQIRELELAACLAVRGKRVDSAQRCWQSLVLHAKIQNESLLDDRNPQIINSLQNLLMFTVRSHNSGWLTSWLLPTWQIVRDLEFYSELGDFVGGIGFAVADGNLQNLAQQLQHIFKDYLLMCRSNKVPLHAFLRSWQEITVQFLPRNLGIVGEVLVKSLFYGLYYEEDWQFLQDRLWQYYMQLKTYVRQNTFEETFKVYGLVHYFELVLYWRFQKFSGSSESFNRQRVICRNILDWQANVARARNVSEEEVILCWRRLMLEGKSTKFCKKFDSLWEGVLRCWESTRPTVFFKFQKITGGEKNGGY